MGAKVVEAVISLAVEHGSSKLHLCQVRRGGGGGEEGGREGGAAHVRFMGAKGVEAGIPLAVGLGSSTLHSGHQVSQALQPCRCRIICHMQPCLQSWLGFTSRRWQITFRVCDREPYYNSLLQPYACAPASRADDK